MNAFRSQLWKWCWLSVYDFIHAYVWTYFLNLQQVRRAAVQLPGETALLRCWQQQRCWQQSTTHKRHNCLNWCPFSSSYRDIHEKTVCHLWCMSHLWLLLRATPAEGQKRAPFRRTKQFESKRKDFMLHTATVISDLPWSLSTNTENKIKPWYKKRWQTRSRATTSAHSWRF